MASNSKDCISKMRIDRSRPALERRVINGPTMGTRYAAVFYAPAGCGQADLAGALQAAVDAVDAQMSTWKPDSNLMQLNRAPSGIWFDIPEQLGTVLSAALEIGRLSDGAFDIGVGDLVAAWGFGSAGGRQDLAALARPGSGRRADTSIELDRQGGRVRKHGDITLDLSGIAKGFGVTNWRACWPGAASSISWCRSMANSAPAAAGPTARPGGWPSKDPRLAGATLRVSSN